MTTAPYGHPQTSANAAVGARPSARPESAPPSRRSERPAGSSKASSEASTTIADPASDAVRDIIQRWVREVGATKDDGKKARLHFEIARLSEKHLGDLEAAVHHYLAAARLMASYVPAIRGARRTMLLLGRTRAALPLFDEELRLLGNPVERAELLYEKGRLFEGTLRNAEEARQAFHAALELDRDNPTYLRAVIRAEGRAKSWSGMAAALASLAASIEGDPTYRAVTLTERARLLEAREKRTGEAMAEYEAALALDPMAPGALGSLKRLFRKHDRYRDLVETLRKGAELTTANETRAIYFHSVARILKEHGQDPDEAIRALENASKADAGDRQLLRELANLYEGRLETQPLLGALARLAETESSPEARIALCLRIGRIADKEVGDKQAARQWYEAAARLSPTSEPVLEALAALYESLGAWDALVAMHLAHAEATSHSRKKALAHATAADIFESKLKRKDEAAKHHAIALGLLPEHEVSFKALTRLYAEMNRFRELTEVYERALDRAPDNERAIADLFRIGSIREDHIGDFEGALHAYRRILGISPQHLGAVQALGRAAERAGQYAVVVEANDIEAEIAESGERRKALHHRSAEILASKLDDVHGAVARLRKVLELDPLHLPSIRLLGSLHYRLGHWDDLFANYKRELAAAAIDDRVAVLTRMGELASTHLGRKDVAVEHYKKALALDPDHAPSFRALTELLSATEAYADLAAVLGERLDATQDRVARAHIALDLGELFEVRLREPEKALVAYERAVEAVPDFVPALDSRARLLHDKGAWETLAHALVAESEALGEPALAIDARFRAGDVFLHRLDQPQKAVECFEWVEQRTTNHLGAFIELGPLYADLGNHEGVTRVLRAQARLLGRPQAKVAALRELAEHLAVHGERTEVQKTYRAILDIAPQHQDALKELARMAEEDGDISSLTYFEARLSATAEDPTVGAFHQLRLAELLESVGDAGALDAYRTALAFDAESLAAVRGFSRVAERSGDAAAIREAADREARVSRDHERAVALLLASAALERDAGRADDAAHDLSRALALDPENITVAKALRDVLFTAGRMEDLVDRLTQAADDARDPRRKAELYLEAAELTADAIGNLPGGINLLDRALKAQHDHGPSVERLANYLERNGDFPRAAAALSQLIGLVGDQESLEPRLRLAKISGERLNDPDLALESYRAVLKADPQNIEALSGVARLELKAGAYDAALRSAEQLASVTRGATARGETMVLVADIYETKSDPVRAAGALREAVALLGPDTKAAERLRAGIARGTATHKEYVEALQKHLRLPGQERKPLGLVFGEIARVLSDEMGQPEQAIAALNEGINRVPDDSSLRLLLARKLRESGDVDFALLELRRLIERDVTTPDAYRRMAEAYNFKRDNREAVASLLPLALLEAATPEEMMAIRGRTPHPAAVPPGALGDDAFRAISVHAAYDSPLAELTASLAETFTKLFPADVGRYGASRRDRLSARSEDPLRAIAEQVALILGIPAFDMYVHESPANDVTVELGSPPVLMVPGWARQLRAPELVFLMARPLVAISRELSAVDRVPPGELALLLTATTRLVVPGFGAGRAPEDQLDGLGRQINKAMSRRSRKTVEEAAARYAASKASDIAAWIVAIQETSARAALLLADDLLSCVQLVTQMSGQDFASGGLAADLVRTWVSESAVRFRKNTAG